MVPDGFGWIHGDLGDARLSNIFLEHGYRYLFGHGGWPGAFWQAPWQFFPHPLSMAFAETLAGNVPFYALFRGLGIDPLSSFQLWIVLASALNYGAALVFLRYQGLPLLACSGGAFVFTFSLPRGAQLHHAQLIPQFYSLIALLGLQHFFLAPTSRGGRASLALFAVMLAWQLWASIYLGWFLILGLFVAGFTVVIRPSLCAALLLRLRSAATTVLACIALFAVLFAPAGFAYFTSKSMVGERSWREVNHYIPGIGSYLSAPESSVFYGNLLSPPSLGGLFRLRNPRETSLFPGFVVFASPLVVLGLFWTDRQRVASLLRAPTLLYITLSSFALVVALSLQITDGFTLWRTVYSYFPAAGAIRGVGRIVLVLLIAWAICVTVVLAYIMDRWGSAGRVLAMGLLALIVIENAQAGGERFPKTAHYARVAEVKNRLAAHENRCRAFYYLRDGRPWEGHLDAMWTSMDLEIPTLNGTSGWTPAKLAPLKELDVLYADKVSNAQLKRFISEWLTAENADLSVRDVCIVRR
jgi:hypothetical protein